MYTPPAVWVLLQGTRAFQCVLLYQHEAGRGTSNALRKKKVKVQRWLCMLTLPDAFLWSDFVQQMEGGYHFIGPFI